VVVGGAAFLRGEGHNFNLRQIRGNVMGGLCFGLPLFLFFFFFFRGNRCYEAQRKEAPLSAPPPFPNRTRSPTMPKVKASKSRVHHKAVGSKAAYAHPIIEASAVAASSAESMQAMKEQFGLEFEDDRVDKKDKRKLRHDKWMSSKFPLLLYINCRITGGEKKLRTIQSKNEISLHQRITRKRVLCNHVS
jgi:hypothetical protein